MSYEIITEAGSQGQFASNAGFMDLVRAAKDPSPLATFLETGVSDCVEEIISDLMAISGEEDVRETAQGLVRMIRGAKSVLISDGVVTGGRKMGKGDDSGEPLADPGSGSGGIDPLQAPELSLSDLLPVNKASGSGILLAFWPPPEIQAKLAVPGGDPPEGLHVTLAYFGSLEDLGTEKVLGIENGVKHFAATHEPIRVTFGGRGRFPASPQSDGKDVVYLGVHSEEIQKFREELVAACEAMGIEPKKNFGYTPHMTLKYISPHAPSLISNPEPVEVIFDKVTLSIGSAKKEFPLQRVDFEIEGQVVKVDKSKHLVFGWFSVIKVGDRVVEDVQGDRISEEKLEDAAYQFVLRSGKSGAMHDTSSDGEVRTIGKVIESCVFTKEKVEAMIQSLKEQGITATIDLGCIPWWGGVHVDDPDVWKKVESGELQGWSIGGKGKREKAE